MPKLTNERIKAFLDAVGRPVSVAEIIAALDLDYDHINELCARLRGMQKRPNQRVDRIASGNKWLWFRQDTESANAVRSKIKSTPRN